MKKIKSIIAISFVALAIATVPYATFAKESASAHKNYSNSIWHRIFSGFFGSRADAESQSKPNISGITAPTVLKVGETGTWSVQASDPKNSSLSYDVDWGEISTMARVEARAAFVQTSTFTHAYANPGTYTVKFTVTNEAGLSATSTVMVHIVGRPAPAAPVISGFSAVSNRSHQATIEWKTDVAANSSLWYGTATPVSTSGNANVSRPAKVTRHSVHLTGLQADTKYYVVVGSSNAGGMSTSSEISFTTPAAPDRTTPVIKSLSAPKEVEAGATATVTVNAYDPNNDTLSYSADWGDETTMTNTALMARPEPIFVQSATFTHVYSEPGTYKATFTAENSAGKKTSSSVEITVTAITDTTKA